MSAMNLRELYPDIYTSNEWIEVSDEIAELFLADKRWEAARRRRMYYHKAQYSLDCHGGMENDILAFPETPVEAYEKKEMQEILCAAPKRCRPLLFQNCNSSKKTTNPNPSPIGIRFGLC